MKYGEIFKNPVTRGLTTIQFLSYFGTVFSHVAIASLLVKLGAGADMIAMIFIAILLPSLVLAPVNGYIIDRFEFKKLILILLIIEMSMTICFMFVDTLEYVWLLWSFLFIRSIAGTIIFTAEMSYLPKVISGETLKAANEVHSIIWSSTFAFGMALGGLSTYYFGYIGTFMIDFSFYVIAFFVMFKLPIAVIRNKAQSAWSATKEVFGYIRANPKTVHIMILHSSVGLTVFDTIVTLLAKTEYKYIIAVPLAIGWINFSRALALMLGPLVFGKHIKMNNLWAVMIFQGITIIIWAYLQYDFTLSLVSMFFVGLFTTSIWSFTYYMLQQNTDEEFLGRVISYNDMVFMFVSVGMTYAIGKMANAGVELNYISMIIGAIFFLVAFYAFLLRDKIVISVDKI
ncbi:putative Major Facilitator Superfamily transporter [Sulfurovum sp. enrichment culture clone C5]|uniref:Putative Major Facilitator Superfamily transporter n=1 Tax=Sulfurovum sp. enrichment culture clone C5 TaxID=497650 RepID=A0A0S4XLU5_9BACT|nr:putative Major Facilitator Superfamily transporter [Sulfurovum sp. enrichment culture clone C5]